MSERKDRMVKCLIDLPAYENDPAVLKMTQQEAGAFFRLLCRLWWMPEPGVIEADDTLLRDLSRTPEHDWPSTRAALEPAFDTERRPGFWIDRRMAESHRTQSEYVVGQRTRGSLGGKAKAAKEGVGSRASSGASTGASSGAMATPLANPSGPGSGSGSDEKKKTTSRASRSFVPPTLEEIRNYCRERGNAVDPDVFLAYYESNGWKVGRNPMEDWRAAIRSWERNGVAASTTAQLQKPSGPHPALQKARKDREEWEREQAGAGEPLGDENAAEAAPDIGAAENGAQDTDGGVERA